MQALRIHRHGAPPVFERDVPAPRPAPGLTLVRVAAAALTHLDHSVASGTFAYSPPLPYVPCGDGAGWVERSGRFAEGALVWVRGGGSGVTRDGLAADLAAVPDEAVHLAPDGVDPVLAACFFSPVTSAYTAVHDVAAVRPGERVAVAGAAGAVGGVAVQLAVAAGAAEVLAVTSRPERLATPDGPVVAVEGLTPRRVDVLIDTVGGPELPDRIRGVVPGGRAVLLGYTGGTQLTLDLPSWLVGDVALLPLNMIRRAPAAAERAGELLRRLADGELTLPIDARPLEGGPAAWAALAAGRVAGRVALVPPGARSGRSDRPSVRTPAEGGVST